MERESTTLICESLIQPPGLLSTADKRRWPVKNGENRKYETPDIFFWISWIWRDIQF